MREREHAWYRENVLTDEQKAYQQKSKVEKRRYIGALKALIKEKGAKLNPLSEDVPALCSWEMAGEDFRNCPSNCQFYNNEKGYVRALRDILHSITAVTAK